MPLHRIVSFLVANVVSTHADNAFRIWVMELYVNTKLPVLLITVLQL